MKNHSIEHLIELVKEDLRRTKYTEHRIAAYQGTWNKLQQFMNETGITAYDSGVGLAFLKAAYGIIEYRYLSKNNTKLRVRAVNMISEYQVHGHVLSKMRWKIHTYPDYAAKATSGYLEYLKHERNLSESTIHIAKVFLKRFFDCCDALKIHDVSMLGPHHIEAFINTLAGKKKCRIHTELCNLRGFLRYLEDHEHVDSQLVHTVPKFSWDKRAEIPSAYSKEEVKRLIGSIDLGNPKGKRDYAMILLAAVMGMRAGEICKLQFNEIKWQRSELIFTQTKTGKRNSLPLLPEVGNAIINYLKYGRPESEEPYIFLRLHPPIGRLRPPTLYSIVTQQMNIAGIKIPKGKKHGPHALRHSLATALLESNTPLPVISEVLGHKDSDTTGIYLKLDIPHLRQCALDVSKQLDIEEA